MMDKTALRHHLRKILRGLSAAEKSTASTRLCQLLQAWPVFQAAHTIALYHPTATEPDLLPLLDTPGKQFLFPLCHPDRQLTWHAAGAGSPWRRSRFGILEPDPRLSPAVKSPLPGLVLVPGLAFTREGDRLGHGAGYYDCFLAALPSDVPTAGVCFHCQLQPSLPCEAHDVRVRHVFQV